MAWNEPGGGNRDPWSGPGKDQGPPDLDEVLKKLQDRVRRLFGGKPSGDGGRSGGTGIGLGLLAAILLVVWLFSGFYIVDQGWQGVVLRFGRHVATTGPGPHWHWPYPVEAVERVNVSEIRAVEIGYQSVGGGRTRPVLDEALMLTEDENIVNVQLAVQYRVEDPASYLFTLRDPDAVLKRLAESALREVVGRSKMDAVLTKGGVEEAIEGEPVIGGAAHVAERTRELVQAALEQYGAGLTVVDVAVQDIQPPEQVQEAFADAVGAREDRQRLINEAEAYANEVLPRAQGEAARMLEEAEAYRARVVAEAQGESRRFLDLLAEYSEAPEVTRARLYLEAMEQVFQRSSKVLVGVESGQPMMYLPLDKFMRGDAAQGAVRDGQAVLPRGELPAQPPGQVGIGAAERGRNIERRREVR